MSYSLRLSICGEAHAVLTIGYRFMGFDFSFEPCSELGQKEFGLWQAELDQLGLLGNSKCENTEGCQPSLETT